MNWDWNRALPLSLLAVSVGALGFAYTAQFGFGLEPCILCFYQRIPYALIGVLAILALGLRPGSGAQTAVFAACAALFFVGAGIAFYHVGVENHWWVSAASCGGGVADQMSAAQLRELLQAKAPKACDDVDWELFGISMAGYNAAYSAILGVLTLAALRMMRKSQ